jgi:exodeoxyribonuclease V gamma subunit
MEELNQGFLFFSNQLESLLTLMGNDIFTCSTPFTTRAIVVPSPEMGEWVKRRLAHEKGIACGIEIFYLNTVVLTLLESLFELPKEKKIPSQYELVFSLRREIQRLTYEDHPYSLPLRAYLKGREEKEVELALTLSTLFQQYALYAPEAVYQWEISPKNWQELLWSRLFQNEWTHLGNLFHQLKFKSSLPDIRLALFSFSHLPKLLFHFFEKVATKVPTALYHLSPCKEFWSDFLSSKEQKSVEGLDLFLEEQHPFLANLGKVGREFAKLLEESAWEPNEVYIVPSKQTALVRFQQGLLNLDTTPITWDSSLQLHCVSSKKREVDALFNALKAGLASGEITPSDVLVMAPSITPYLPFIEALFEGEIPYRVADIESMNEIGLFKLLEIDEKRWSSLALLNLFSFPPFQEKQGWGESELKQIQQWIQQTGVRWGVNEAHRKEYLPSFEGGEGGTWISGLHQLFEQLATGDLSFTTCSLLEQLLSIVESLFDDLQNIRKKEYSLLEWNQEIVKLSEKYFQPHSAQEELLKSLDKICKAGLQGELFSLKLLLPLIKEEAGKRRGKVRAAELEAVSFSSFLPLRTIPAKWIWIMGMEDTAFPRTEHHHPLDRLREVPSSYFPSCVDYDRYLFLEAVLSCRSTFCVSYVGLSEGEKVPPSSVVSDFCRHFDQVEERVHPHRSYDPVHFENGSASTSFIESDYQLARALYSISKPRQPSKGISLPTKKSYLVSELQMLAKSPLRYYLKENQGIQFRENQYPSSDETFILTSLQKWAIQNEAHSHNITTVKERFLKRGDYPTGIFGKIADLSIEGMETELEIETLSLDENPLILTVDKEEVEIRGVLNCLSDRGIVVYGKKCFGSLAKIWPSYLIACIVTEKMQPLFFLKDGKTICPIIKGPENALVHFIQYAEKCRRVPSYLYPEWILPIAGQESEKLKKQVYAPHFDPALQWMHEGGHLPKLDELIHSSYQEVHSLFEEVIDAWL